MEKWNEARKEERKEGRKEGRRKKGRKVVTLKERYINFSMNE